MKDHLILLFWSKADYYVVLKDSPWFVAGQLLMMEEWELYFISKRKVINKAVAQLRLSVLPMKFWVSSIILAIATEANRPLAMDNFTNLLWNMGMHRSEWRST